MHASVRWYVAVVLVLVLVVVVVCAALVVVFGEYEKRSEKALPLLLFLLPPSIPLRPSLPPLPSKLTDAGGGGGGGLRGGTPSEFRMSFFFGSWGFMPFEALCFFHIAVHGEFLPR